MERIEAKIADLLQKVPLNTDMINEKHVGTVLKCLDFVLQKKVPGSIVELGCNKGNMGIYIQQLALEHKRKYHAYDSFEGLPPHSIQDESTDRTAKGGDLGTSIEEFMEYFDKNNVPLPTIHKGWFNEQEYPDKIAFAFLDGDFYNSIMDSWQAIYPRLTPGAMVCVHDYGFPPLIGVKQACDAFLKNKECIQFWDDYVAIYLF